MSAVAGHFGEWLQGRLGPDGPLALVTLACPVLQVRATYTPSTEFTVTPPDLLPPQRAITLFEHLGLPQTGQYALQADMPLGGGAGASTAALVALARAAGYGGSDLAAACLAAEGASDPLMHPNPDALLWAPRAAQVLKMLPAPFAFEVVGGFWGAPERTDPQDLDFPDISDLVQAWGTAPDAATQAQLASQSAVRTTALRGPVGDPMPDLAHDLGALGYARAHTGSARALLFAPGTVPETADTVLRAAGLGQVIRFTTGGRV